jgi:hypothetical protein
MPLLFAGTDGRTFGRRKTPLSGLHPKSRIDRSNVRAISFVLLIEARQVIVVPSRRLECLTCTRHFRTLFDQPRVTGRSNRPKRNLRANRLWDPRVAAVFRPTVNQPFELEVLQPALPFCDAPASGKTVGIGEMAMTLASQAPKTRDMEYSVWFSEPLMFVGAAGFIAISPYLFARVIFQLMQSHFPTSVQLVVVSLLFVIVCVWAWLIIGKRRLQLFTQTYKLGILWPLLFSAAMLLFALMPFAALSSILADLGYTTFEPSVPKGEFWRLQDLYLWHFFNSVPSLKITETLLWEEPFQYKDRLSGALLLAFKIIVIVPVIASFAAWWKESTDVSKRSSD